MATIKPGYLTHTTPVGRDAEIVVLENCLTQLINEPMRILSLDGLQQYMPDLFTSRDTR